MYSRRSLAAVANAVAACGTSHLLFNQSATQAEAKSPTVASSLSHLSPTPPLRIVRPNPNLEIAFDTRTRNPIYVLERLVVNNNERRRHKRPNFYEDKSLPEPFRSRNGHYRNSGYDRGHLAPAADFQDEKEYGDTFTLCNISPQEPSMNRQVWANLEEWTRKVASRAWKQDRTTYVLTGPLWLPTRKMSDNLFEYGYKAIGTPPSLVSVPTHFFKVVVVVHQQAIVQFACFAIPNLPLDSKASFGDYLVRWTDLEAVVGMMLFPVYSRSPDWKELADAVTESIWKFQKKTPLLLTDGTSNRKYGRPKVSLRHLCADGACDTN